MSDNFIMSAMADYERSIRKALAVRGGEMDAEMLNEMLAFIDTAIRILKIDNEAKGEQQ